MAPALEKLTAQQEHTLLTLAHLLKGDVFGSIWQMGKD